MLTKFGKKISLAETEQFYLSVQEIKARTANKLKEAFKDDIEAQRFYLGSEVAYFFSKEMIFEIAQKLENIPDKEDPGAILYLGSKYDTKTKRNGRPTLMIFPYKTTKDENGQEIVVVVNGEGDIVYKTDAENQEGRFFVKKTSASGGTAQEYIDNEDNGIEHPGGGSTGNPSVLQNIEDGLPVKFLTSSIQPGLF